MKIKQQLFIDKFLAKPFAYLLNFLVRLLGKVLSIDHNLHQKFDRIVICKFKGMGSIIQATPMIQAIRNQHPNATLIFMSSAMNRSFLEKIDTLDEIITIDDKNPISLVTTLFSSLFKLLKKRPDVYIDLEIYSNFSTLVTLFSLSKNRIGFYLRSSSFKMGIYTHMMFFNTQTPIANAYLQIARLFGEVKELPELYPLGNNSTPPKQTLLGSEYIVINPNASDLRLERRWGRQNFRVLIESILQKHPELKVVLIGSKGEKSYTESVIVDLKNDRLINLAGQTSIDELISTIQHAKLIITNDTGPMHIAFACNTPSICFFGPCSPTQYASANNSIVLYKNVYCSPCVHDFSIPPCNGDNVCMKLIEVAEVMKAVNHFFANSGDSRPVSSQHKVLYHHDKNVIGQVQRNILT